MKYGLSKKQLDEIIKILAKYPKVEEAILFGSRALGTFKAASDIDLAIKGSEVDFFLAAHLKSEFEEETNIPFFFDVIAFDSISNEVVKTHIREFGKILYKK